MKLKYKKIILLTAISVMGIGLLTLSLSNDRTEAKESGADKKTAAYSKDQEAASLTPTVAPSPTALPVYEIEEDANPKITKLFTEFYTDKKKHAVKALKKLLSDPEQVESKSELQKKTEYIEDYKNIKTYAKKGYQEGTYIVYVYHEIKFTGITTAAPGLSKFYVITDAKGALKIYSGDMDEATKEYYDARNDDEDVAALIKMTNKKSDKAVKKDKDLKVFWEKIDKLAKKASTKKNNTTAE